LIYSNKLFNKYQVPNFLLNAMLLNFIFSIYRFFFGGYFCDTPSLDTYFIYLFIYFNDDKPLHGRATSCIHPCQVNFGLCKAPPLHGSGNSTSASPAGWPQRIVCTQGDSNLRPHRLSQRLRPLPLEPIPWGLYFIYLSIPLHTFYCTLLSFLLAIC
jgi:hypothetical protein